MLPVAIQRRGRSLDFHQYFPECAYMSKPLLLPIKRMEDLHTKLIGRCGDNQFLITETPLIELNGERIQRIYVICYTFDQHGEFIAVDYVSIEANASDLIPSIESANERLLKALGPFEFRDILVKLFELEIDGIVFGLVYSSETDSVNLEPGPVITFMEPWDGEYYT